MYRDESIMFIRRWWTPASKYPEQRRGDLVLYHARVPKGKRLYMNSVMGYDYCIFLDSVSITILQEGEADPMKSETIWMSDTPMEWYGMAEYAIRMQGPKILIGGLGLGLILWWLRMRDDIDKIVVVEKSKDVIEMVSPYLPRDDRIEIIYGDFLDVAPKLANRGFNSVFVDIWREPYTEEADELYLKVRKLLDKYYPNTEQFYWAYQRTYEKEYYTMIQHDLNLWRRGL